MFKRRKKHCKNCFEFSVFIILLDCTVKDQGNQGSALVYREISENKIHSGIVNIFGRSENAKDSLCVDIYSTNQWIVFVPFILETVLGEHKPSLSLSLHGSKDFIKSSPFSTCLVHRWLNQLVKGRGSSVVKSSIQWL